MNGNLATVLIVDDLEDDIYMTRWLLGEPRGMRCTFVEACDGKAALDLVDGARREHVDLILLDLNMPVMNGFETLEALRADPDLSKIPVVVQTGSLYERDKARARALGAAGYLEKPVQLNALASVIETLPGLRLTAAPGQPPALMRIEQGAH